MRNEKTIKYSLIHLYPTRSVAAAVVKNGNLKMNYQTPTFVVVFRER